jgi:hypothetical protein
VGQKKRAVRKAEIVAAIEMNRRYGCDGLTMGKIAHEVGMWRGMHFYGLVRELVAEGVLCQRDEYYRPTFLKVMYSINPSWLQSGDSELHRLVGAMLGTMQQPLVGHDILINGKSWLFHQSKTTDTQGNTHTISPYTITE